jgi:hypothetical protein
VAVVVVVVVVLALAMIMMIPTAMMLPRTIRHTLFAGMAAETTSMRMIHHMSMSMSGHAMLLFCLRSMMRMAV